MVIELPNGKTYAIHFHFHELEYPKRHVKTRRGDKKPLKRRACTITLHEGKCPDNRPRGQACTAARMVQGVAECSPLDAFDRTKGRNLAFKRAAASLPHEDLEPLFYAWSASKAGKKLRYVQVLNMSGRLVTGRVAGNKQPKKHAVTLDESGTASAGEVTREVGDGQGTVAANPTADAA
jgi:hypothetical protein